MNEIDKEKCGAFIAALRREKRMTQKELAEKLFVSDKAVSKWERGLSLPDVALLEPISEGLGVSLTELLRGERAAAPLGQAEMDVLMAETVRLSAGEKRAKEAKRRRWGIAYAVCAGLGCAGVGLCHALGYEIVEMGASVLLVEGFCLLFGGWLCFWAKERLPAYYDENKISFYGDGVFRLNMAGIHLNNSNWPHVLDAMRGWLLGTAALFPPLWLILRGLTAGRDLRLTVELPLTLFACLGMMIPAYVVGKRYE